MQNPTYNIINSGDNSPTIHNASYDESYHSVREGALNETLHKHINPPFKLLKLADKPILRVLDICFGLGYNSLCAIAMYRKYGFSGRLEIYSPELDSAILGECLKLNYPKELADSVNILEILHKQSAQKRIYESQNTRLEVYIGEANMYLLDLQKQQLKFDIIYQDPFSPPKNPELWNLQHFKALAMLLSKDGIITTYSQSMRALFAAHLNNLLVYSCVNQHGRDFSLCSHNPLKSDEYQLKLVNWEQKLERNPTLTHF